MPLQRAASQGISPQDGSATASVAQGSSSQRIPEQHAPSLHPTLAAPPGRVSVLALSAGFRLLCMLPLLLAVWLAVAWALAD